MKKIIFTMLFLLSTAAQAVDLEASIGQSFNASGASWSIGATGLVADGWRYRAGFASLGAQKLDTSDTDISADDELAAGEAAGQRYWVAPKRVNELYATIAPEWYFGNWTVYVEGGLAVYHPMAQADLLPGEPLPPDDNRVNVTYIAGVGIGYGRWSVSISRQNITETVDWVEGYPNSAMVTTAVRYRF